MIPDVDELALGVVVQLLGVVEPREGLSDSV